MLLLLVLVIVLLITIIILLLLLAVIINLLLVCIGVVVGLAQVSLLYLISPDLRLIKTRPLVITVRI